MNKAKSRVVLNGILVDMLYGECCVARSFEVIGVTYMQFSKVMRDFMLEELTCVFVVSVFGFKRSGTKIP